MHRDPMESKARARVHRDPVESKAHTHTDWTRLEWIGPHFFAILVVEIGLRS